MYLIFPAMCKNKDLGGFVNHTRLAEAGLGMYERRYEGQADEGDCLLNCAALIRSARVWQTAGSGDGQLLLCRKPEMSAKKQQGAC